MNGVHRGEWTDGDMGSEGLMQVPLPEQALPAELQEEGSPSVPQMPQHSGRNRTQ